MKNIEKNCLLKVLRIKSLCQRKLNVENKLEAYQSLSCKVYQIKEENCENLQSFLYKVFLKICNFGDYHKFFIKNL